MFSLEQGGMHSLIFNSFCTDQKQFTHLGWRKTNIKTFLIFILAIVLRFTRKSTVSERLKKKKFRFLKVNIFPYVRRSWRMRLKLPIFWNSSPKNIPDRQKCVDFQKSKEVLNHSTLLWSVNNIVENPTNRNHVQNYFTIWIRSWKKAVVKNLVTISF